MAQIWKILHGHDDVDEKVWFDRFSNFPCRDTRLSTSEMNLRPKSFRLDIRKNSGRQLGPINIKN